MAPLKTFLFTCILTVFFSQNIFAFDYEENNLLLVLSESKNSQQFKAFSDFWQLDTRHENKFKGIKLNVNQGTGKVESILLTGKNTEEQGIKFSKCTSKLPFGLSMDDDSVTLFGKLGDGQFKSTNVLRFYQQGIVIEAAYKGGEMAFMKFYKKEEKNTSVAQARIAVKPEQGQKSSLNEKTRAEQAAFAARAAKIKSKPAVAGSPFKNAVMDVFKTSKESGFWKVKGDQRKGSNFWNYKFAYNTKLKIPGEKYNILYSFPFSYSTLDFVSVIKESDAQDQSFEVAYHLIEKQLLESFPASEGWVGACIPNTDGSKLSDIEIMNDRYGSVILDSAKNPKGRYVLYLRFLLFS